ncbi:MAG: aspartyl protease family protein [Prevotellaceae bacterium]|jgi:clan AA aspartic protease|nr:aspartyl protease family protein [Prevotellaceae bacterium]
MGVVQTEITLKNGLDVSNAELGLLKQSDIRQTTLQAIVDTGAWTLVINEDIRKQLGLRISGTDPAPSTLADGTEVYSQLAGPLEVYWRDRRVLCDALVLPNAQDVLLGAIPLEAMDLVVSPRTLEVVGAHGDQAMHRLGFRASCSHS